ncbi:MAG: molybdopterin molybdotransferase MoeA [Chthoniobacterales bacterium]
MTSEADARAAVLEKIIPRPGSSRPLADALGRFATSDIVAERPLPAFDNSAMDGYAVQSATCQAGARLQVIAEQPAGTNRGLTIGAGQAVRIFTGAPLPHGADAVIMQEDVTRDGDTITAQCAAEPGEFIRRQASDLAIGQKILGRGDPIRAATLGLLASQGLAEVDVGPAPRVAIVATGDELARLGETPRPGQIFESNSVMLHALSQAAGGRVDLLAHAPDDLDTLTKILREGATCDVMIISGGVSVGDRDLVKPALRMLGAEIDLWRVALKPGKPFLFGTTANCYVFGLPGNPVSAFVTFLKFVRPALRQLMGASPRHLELRGALARLGSDVSNDGDRPHYLRGELRDGIWRNVGRQESHALFGLSQANALLRLGPGETFHEGSLVNVELWD